MSDSSNNSLDPKTEISALPQYGFGEDVNFDSLVKSNHLLFRVYTPKERSPFFDDSDPFFIAAKYNEKYAPSPVAVSPWQLERSEAATYADVAKHMDWSTSSSSPFISTSFSFIWSIWEALRRYHLGIKKDIEIAVIDAAAVSDRSLTAVQVLRSCPPNERRHREHWKWYRFAQESQAVLVRGSIPGTAVLASIPLLSILEKLPSYFLHSDLQANASNSNPLAQIAWDYTDRKPHYRQFCQEMSNRFFTLTSEARLRDATAGSVRLAMAFLRPWFYRTVVNEPEMAVDFVSRLALSIAQWPGQWWVQDHTELADIVLAITVALGEEIREKHRLHAKAEVSRLQEMVDGLESIIGEHKTQVSLIIASAEEREERAHKLTESESLAGPLPVESEPPKARRRESPLTISVPSKPFTASAFQTPITPPESPLCDLESTLSSFSASPSLSKRSSIATMVEPDYLPTPPLDAPIPTSPKVLACTSVEPLSPILELSHITKPSKPSNDVNELSENETFAQTLSTSIALTPPIPQFVTTATLLGNPSTIEASESLVNTSVTIVPNEVIESVDSSRHSEPEPETNPATSLSLPRNDTQKTESEVTMSSLTFPIFSPDSPYDLPLSVPGADIDLDEEMASKPSNVVETASCLVTGFLIGAFITLCILSPQRRTLLYLT